jgi:hypothetical protein
MNTESTVAYKATANLHAKYEMGLVDVNNPEAIMLAAADSLEEVSQLRRPEAFQLFSIIMGGMMAFLSMRLGGEETMFKAPKGSDE